MAVSVFPAFGYTVRAEEAAEKTEAAEPAEKVLFDYNCDKFDTTIMQVTPGTYPHTYIFDSTRKDVDEGTLRFGSSGTLNSHANIKIPLDMKNPAFALDLSMKVNSLAAFGESIYCGFVLEVHIPDNRVLFLSVQDLGEPDENGKNAVLLMSKTKRGQKEAAVRIAIPTDGEFHNWQFQFDGKGELRLLIDGQVQATITEITANAEVDSAYMMLKNVMTNVVSGLNDVIIDHIKVTEGITMSSSQILAATATPDSSAKNLTVTATVNKIPADAEMTVIVTPYSDPAKAEKKSYTPEDLTSSVTFTDLPFTGLCTVEVQMTNTPAVSFKQYLYDELTYVTEAGKIENDVPDHAFVFNKMDLAERPKDSLWKETKYVNAAGEKAVLLSIPAEKDAHSFTVPVELTGKFAVYVGYVAGAKSLNVNDKNVFIAFKVNAADEIREVFALADDFDGTKITVANDASVAAQVAYVKLVSLSDEQYELYLKEDDSQNLMKDNDGYSIFTKEAYSKPENLINSVLTVPSERYNLGKFNFAMFSTSILNYDSEVWWKYVYARMDELGIPREKAPKDFLSHIDTKGEVMDFGDKWRDADIQNYANIRAINEYGAPHVILADYAAEHELGEVYASLRMSHYNGIDSLYPFQSGAFYYLHPEWLIDAGTYQLSYMHEEYRNYLHDLLMEMAAPENVAGITMDFGRYPRIFGQELADVEKRTEILNDFVKSIHDDLPEGKVLNARVLNPTKTQALDWGLDYEHWCEQGWIDRLIISDQTHETFFNFDEYMAFFEKCPDVEFYLGINGTLSGHDTTKEEEEIMKAGGYVEGKELVRSEDFMLRAYDAYMAGADGIFLFNGPSSDPQMGGIPPYYAYMNNKTLMEKWYTFEYPQSLFTEKISFLTNGAKLSVTVEGKKTLLDLPATDADWKAAPSLTEEDLTAGYKATANEAEAAYRFDEETGDLTIDITYNFGYWVGDMVLTDANGKEIPFTTDRLFGKGGTLWHFKYMEQGKENAIKTLTLTVDGVKELPDSYTIFLTNHGTSNKYTAKLTLAFTKTAAADKPSSDAAKPAETAKTAGTPAAVTVEGKTDHLTLPASDAAWKAAPSPTAEELKGSYKATAKTAEAAYTYDKEAGKLTIAITYNFNYWVGDMVLTDANGKKIDFKTDRTFGKDGTLWHFKYMEQGKDHAIKTLTLTVDGVNELPDSYVLFVENWGTSNKYTARLTIDLTKAK